MSDSEEHQEILQKPKLSYWRRLGGGSLFISLAVHAILLGIGVVLIIGVIPPPPEKVVDFIAPGGGGAPASSTKQQKRANVVRNNASRVAAKDVVSNFTLPDPEASSDMSALGALGAGGMGGLGGMGSGGGKGMGTGEGIGAGMGAGIGSGSGINPFGMINPNRGALIGTFYDLKQTKDRKPTGYTDQQMRDMVKEFGRKNWREQTLNDYFQVPQKLYQTKIYIPAMSADLAPAAFKAEKEVEPRRWVIIYRGNVIAPKTGRFRFVGCADDVLAVRFNGKNSLDYGFQRVNEGRDYPMEDGHPKYSYVNAKQYERMGGIGAGPTFSVRAGQSYPIEIIVGEVPGGTFCATLMIEEIGAKYEKTAEGSPILPLFRTDNSLPAKSNQDCAIPFDPTGPVWEISEGTERPGI